MTRSFTGNGLTAESSTSDDETNRMIDSPIPPGIGQRRDACRESARAATSVVPESCPEQPK